MSNNEGGCANSGNRAAPKLRHKVLRNASLSFAELH